MCVGRGGGVMGYFHSTFLASFNFLFFTSFFFSLYIYIYIFYFLTPDEDSLTKALVF